MRGLTDGVHVQERVNLQVFNLNSDFDVHFSGHVHRQLRVNIGVASLEMVRDFVVNRVFRTLETTTEAGSMAN
jgi:hypothetical protein